MQAEEVPWVPGEGMADQPPMLRSAQAMADHLQAGGAGVMPTDTLPALVAVPAHAKQIWTLKQRPAEKPLILMASTSEPLLALATAEVRKAARPLVEQHWPGALTLVVPLSNEPLACALVECLNPGATTLGLRVPACEQARGLMECTGPLATTSANPSGEPPALNPYQASLYFPQVPLLGPLPWPQPGGQASTVLAWVGQGRWQTLRQGAVIL